MNEINFAKHFVTTLTHNHSIRIYTIFISLSIFPDHVSHEGTKLA